MAPSPPGHWLLGHLPERKRDPLGLYLGAQRSLGDVVRFRMGPVHVEQLTHPDHVRHVLVEATDVYGKGAAWAKTKPLIGDGLVTSEGPLWRQQRHLAQPAFHQASLAGLATTMTDCVQETLDRWARLPADEPVPVFTEMRALALRIVLRSLFGVDLDDRIGLVGDSFTAALEVTDRRILSPLPYRPRLFYTLPTRDNRTFTRSVRALDAVVDEVVAARTRSGPRDDLLGLLVTATATEVGTIDRRQLRDEIVTLLLAGFETTANALTWAFALLDEAPNVWARLCAEVDGALGGRVPQADDLARLPYARAVVEEVLRLRPPLWAIPRVPSRDDVVDGFRVPAGDVVILVPYVTHRHPDFWTDPETFDPDRFSPERRRHLPRGAYLPFGAGKRQCLGVHFAMMEAQLVLAMVVQRFRPRHVGGPTEPDPYVTLRPHGVVPMRLERR